MRIVVADDSVLLREGLQLLLAELRPLIARLGRGDPGDGRRVSPAELLWPLLPAEEPGEAADRGAEVLRPLGGDAEGVPPPPGLPVGELLAGQLLVGDLLGVLDRVHAALFSPIWDCTISW